MQSREVGREDSFAGDLFPISTIPAVPVERIRQALTVVPIVRPRPLSEGVCHLRDPARPLFGPPLIRPAPYPARSRSVPSRDACQISPPRSSIPVNQPPP